MIEDSAPVPTRRPRADAERNRNRLMAAAKTAFAERGSAASLDEIARASGVGIGTLYRHFPTREALIEATYRKESEQIAASAARLAQTHDPVEALREWLLLFVDYIAAKRGMLEALNAAACDAAGVKAESGARLSGAIGALLERAAASGEIRLVMAQPLDLLRALGAVANASPESKAAARQLVDILIAGMRART